MSTYPGEMLDCQRDVDLFAVHSIGGVFEWWQPVKRGLGFDSSHYFSPPLLVLAEWLGREVKGYQDLYQGVFWSPILDEAGQHLLPCPPRKGITFTSSYKT